MATTTNFGWETPDDTDLVKDGALAMRTLGNAIDASLVDLKGGTTGQVLSKNSNTDMDFTWVTSDDANAIQNTIVDAKGDLITATSADTPSRIAVGNNGETLVADSSASTGLRWQGNFAAGKNKIINGDMFINQRSFTSTTTDNAYTFDRFKVRIGGDGTSTFSAQTFTPGSAPVSGYEGANYMRIVTASQTTNAVRTVLRQPIESVRTLAGQTVTLSFWARANSGTPKIAGLLAQNFGSGGSASNDIALGLVTISTSWARYSFTTNLTSLTGKTIGSADQLVVDLCVSAGSDFNTPFSSIGIQNNTFEIWGVQLEAGNTATAFQTATGTLAGELAACQRYYYRQNAQNLYNWFGYGMAYNSTNVGGVIVLPVTMRTSPTSVDYSTLALIDFVNSPSSVTSVTVAANDTGLNNIRINFGCSGGLTQYRFYGIGSNNSTSGYIGINAEL